MNTNNFKPIWAYLFLSAAIYAVFSKTNQNLLGSKPPKKNFEYKCTCGKSISKKQITWHPTSTDHIGGDTFIFGTCKFCRSTHPIRRELLVGGRGDNLPDSAFDRKTLEDAISHELEHTTNKEIAKEIAKDHLTEDDDYYKKLVRIEKK